MPHQSGPGGPGEPIVEIKAVTCGYEKQQVLTDVSLTIMPGDFVGLLGPSGSGKTTLLRTVLGAVDLYEGEVLVNGVATTKKRPRVGYVPQLETIDWNFPVTVQEVVMMGRTMENKLFPWYRKEEKDLAAEMMSRLGILDLADRHIRELSGGQQQRVFLARALISSPQLLLLDEPTSGVDIKTRDDVMHLLHDLNHDGVTIIITTHEINAVAVHLPWIVCLAGRILAEGPPSEVITTEVLRLTYGAEMPVIHYEGMTIVAESPHSYGRNGDSDGKASLPPVHVHEPGGNPEDEAIHVREHGFDPEIEARHVRDHRDGSEHDDSHAHDHVRHAHEHSPSDEESSHV
ncbi:MAG: metal ABC transporter ATP-binding protein [SAR202 cluster bacterium]|nr:metal ABC transporter ATP-binding protein [SAR202 cluster bacterium]MQG12954.1 metal ABC transporter ATP-binding protein [SAR202 cluster bacterium]MQG42556.1 metal ABC transporter ATP-binding protein [SAR202 cluster bacterium]MQG62147.1 metal ABC transporter ATP-binding protein [SAR202 cluster bacterium]MQG70994.1 metal ABC transporter ATP-binding protein [SAR202 cluster bacterium]